MLVIAGTISFESSHFISVTLGAKKDERNGNFRLALNVKLDNENNLSVVADDRSEIMGMYYDILSQLSNTGGLTYNNLIDKSWRKSDELANELDEVNRRIEEAKLATPTPKTEGE